MFCPCCAGRTFPSIYDPNRSDSSNGDSRSSRPEQFEIHRTSEPLKPCIPGDLLSDPLPSIIHLPPEFIQTSLPDWVYHARTQRHAIWGYLSHDQICNRYAERLIVENDNKLSQLYAMEEVLRNLRLPDFLAKEGGSCYSSSGMGSGYDHYSGEGLLREGDRRKRRPLFG